MVLPLLKLLTLSVALTSYWCCFAHWPLSRAVKRKRKNDRYVSAKMTVLVCQNQHFHVWTSEKGKFYRENSKVLLFCDFLSFSPNSIVIFIRQIFTCEKSENQPFSINQAICLEWNEFRWQIKIKLKSNKKLCHFVKIYFCWTKKKNSDSFYWENFRLVTAYSTHSKASEKKRHWQKKRVKPHGWRNRRHLCVKTNHRETANCT